MKKKASCFVAELDLAKADKLRHGLIEQGFEISEPQYTLFSGKKKGISCTLYQSGKLTVQGKEMGEFIEFYLEPEILHTFTFRHKELELDLTEKIGTDETGKGDYFGPLCIAAVHGNKDSIRELFKSGICDSKKISDKTIPKFVKIIREICKYHVIVISPEKYNELYNKFKNLNTLLAWGHATAIDELVKKTNCKNILVDQFASKHVLESAVKQKKLDLNLTQKHRAEEDVVVAAASILARDAYLHGLKKLSDQYKIKLPKGAVHKIVETGKKLIDKHGKEVMTKVAKLHFKTTQNILF